MRLTKPRVAFLLLILTSMQLPCVDAVTTAAERFDYHSIRGRLPKRANPDRLEAETELEIEGGARTQGMDSFGPQWSGNTHLLWDGKVGESMETSFELGREGIYDVRVRMTVAPDYGVFEMTLAGETRVEDIDLFSEKVDLAPAIELKEVALKAGRNSVTFKLTGSNPKAKAFCENRYLLGIDYVDVIPHTTEVSGTALAAGEHPAQTTNQPAPIAKPLSIERVVSVLGSYCYDCHGGDEVEGDLQLDRLTERTTWLADIETTRKARDAVSRHEMPPKEADQPSVDIRAGVVATLNSLIDEYLKENRSEAQVVMRRLNRYEYNNAVRDLLKLKGDIYPLPEKTIRAASPYFDPASGRFPRAVVVGNRTLGKNQVERQMLTGVSPFAIDLQAEGGFNNRGNQLSISPILLESFLKLGRSIVNSPEFDNYCGLASELFEPPPNADKETQLRVARERLEQLLAAAFRENVDETVIDRYHAFFEKSLAATDSFQQSMKATIAGVLASPKFIYIAESASNTGDLQLAPWELATRLSFFLWSSIPDAELAEVARDGSIVTPEVLDAQVKRMLEHPRSQALSQNFARQWLRLDQLITAVPDFERFEQYYARIGCEQWKFGLQTMIEPLLLFESIMVEDRSIMLLIDSNYAYRSDEMQSWYYDDAPFGNKTNRNRFNTNQQRFRRRLVKSRREGGVLTTTATLTMTSAPLRTSPIVRGAWVATVILNQPPPPPPDDVPPIEADDKAIEAKGITLRQRLVQHQVNDNCKACHAKIDPLGFALENFDAVGRWRDNYNENLKIDASGELFGIAKFNDVVGLKDALLDNPEWFMRAFTEHMLSYALARELELSDGPAVDHILARVAADRGQFTTVVREIVQSHPFRYRAATDPAVSSAEEPK